MATWDSAVQCWGYVVSCALSMDELRLDDFPKGKDMFSLNKCIICCVV